tara:strand:+ start:517 stop:732 length:216 start_codon:yes stop_codon:yes gene_type:complete
MELTDDLWEMVTSGMADLWEVISCKFDENNPDEGYRLKAIYDENALILKIPSWMDQLTLNNNGKRKAARGE